MDARAMPESLSLPALNRCFSAHGDQRGSTGHPVSNYLGVDSACTRSINPFNNGEKYIKQKPESFKEASSQQLHISEVIKTTIKPTKCQQLGVFWYALCAFFR